MDGQKERRKREEVRLEDKRRKEMMNIKIFTVPIAMKIYEPSDV